MKGFLVLALVYHPNCDSTYYTSFVSVLGLFEFYQLVGVLALGFFWLLMSFQKLWFSIGFAGI